MINGDMAEAQRGFAVLDDVDEETIRRFIEWAYKGYYTAGCFRQVLEAPPELDFPEERAEEETDATFDGIPIDDGVLEEVVDEPFGTDSKPIAYADDHKGWGASSSTLKSSKKSKLKGKKARVIEDVIEDAPPPLSPPPSLPEPSAVKQDDFQYWGFSTKPSNPIETAKPQTNKTRRELKESFLKYDYKVRRNTITLPPTRGNRGPLEDYTDVFLSHARLYVFAEMYDIQILKLLALEELHSTLANYTLYQQRAGDIIALLRYVYANTSGEEGGGGGGGGNGGGGGGGGGGGELRKLLTDYMGYEMGILIKDGKFKDLMIEDGGDLLGDFMKMVTVRIE